MLGSDTLQTEPDVPQEEENEEFQKEEFENDENFFDECSPIERNVPHAKMDEVSGSRCVFKRQQIAK